MKAWVKQYQTFLAVALSTAAALTLLSGLAWKAYAQERVADTAQAVARSVVSDSLAPIRGELARTTDKVEKLAEDMKSVPEDLGLIKDILVELYPERYKKVKENRALKK